MYDFTYIRAKSAVKSKNELDDHIAEAIIPYSPLTERESAILRDRHAEGGGVAGRNGR